MANSLTALAPKNFRPMVQDFLINKLVALPISRSKEFNPELVDGNRIEWPYLSPVRSQSYTDQTDATIDDVDAVQDYMDIDQSRIVTFHVTPKQVRQAKDKKWPAKMAKYAAYALANEMDQKLLKEGVDQAANTVAGGALTTSNLFGYITDAMAYLEDENALSSQPYCVVDPKRRALLTQIFVANGFDEADTALRNGFIGKAAGFVFYVSNNLPTSVTLTCDTQPTATDTFTVKGVTFTCVADGAAAAAGEINIGADLADFKTIFVDAINGANAGTDYVDVSKEDRRKLQNAGISAATFATNDCVITAAGRMSAAETFTTGTNVFGTETGSLLAGVKGATSLGLQMMPEVYLNQEPKQVGKNHLTYTEYGKKVFHRDTFKLVDLTMNV